jgi:hypothetical protein
MPRTQVALAGRIKPGDTIIIDGRPAVISRVKRAQGRKPAAGENLHLVAEDGELLRINSLAPVRIEVRTTS